MASHTSEPPCTMAGRERSPLPFLTPGRIARSNATQVPPETAVSGEDLFQANVSKDAVATLQPVLKEPSKSFTAAIAVCLN